MEQLGIQPVQLLMQIINFSILLFLLTRFLYKPLMKMIKDRQHVINEGLKLRDSMAEQQEKLEELKKKKVAEGRSAANKLVQEARDEAKKQRETIIKDAHAEAADILEKAQKEIDVRKKQMQADLQHEVVDLAADMAERAISDLLAKEDNQHKVLQERLKALAKIKA